MTVSDLAKLGSETAKGGFRNEKDIVKKFNNWKNDDDAKKWLMTMNYNLKDIEKVVAVQIHGYKTDVQVQITIYMKKAISAENLSVKLVSNPRGYNQIDKRWIKKYSEMRNISKDVEALLKLYTGETKPKKMNLTDSRRMFLNEMSKSEQNKIIDFFKRNRILVISDIIKGRGKFSAGWMLVVLRTKSRAKWCLKDINKAMNIFGEGGVRITERGSLQIGKITMQRKGGDGGRETANMLQFKINPVELFG